MYPIKKFISRFGLQVGLAKFNCSSVGLTSQDLVPGDGQAIQKGDMLEVQYTGWLLSNHAFGKVGLRAKIILMK